MSAEELEDLLARFLLQREQEDPPTAEQFAAAHPHVDGLLAALHDAIATEELLPRVTTLPERIGDYRVLRLLGSGGAARVFRVAPLVGPGAERALKLLSPAAVQHPRGRDRFRREADALRRLDSPGVVKVHEVGEHDGCPYLVMDLVAGESLATRIDRARTGLAAGGRRPRSDLLALEGPDGSSGAQRAAALVAAIARAVQEAHDHGLLHRDLKPANVLLRADDGRPVLIDFGLAVGDDHATLTRTGDVLGTPHFMAPEQARGEPADVRTDVYGLGAVLYQLLTLEVPHPGGDVTTVMEQVKRVPPRPPRRIDHHVPRTLDHIVRRATSHRGTRRYAAAADLAAALDAFAGGRPTPRATLSLGARLEDLWLWHRRRLAVAAAALLVALFAMAWIGVAAERRAQDRDRIAAALRTALADADADGIARLAPRLLALDPGNPLATVAAARAGQGPAPAGDGFAACLAEGMHHLDGDDARAAKDPLLRALALEPAEPLATALVGRAALRAGDLDGAERELGAAVRLLPESVQVMVDMAWLYRQRKDFAAAVLWAERAAAADSAAPERWHDLARMLAYADRAGDALSAIERALQRAGGEPPLGMLRTKGAILDSLERFDEAIALLRQVADRAPSTSNHLNLALALDKAHRPAEAHDAYQAALALDGEFVPALFNLAHLHAGGTPNCEQCRQWFASHPDYLDPERSEQYVLRVLHAQRGRYDLAVPCAELLARIGRTERLAAEIERLLGEDLPEAALGRLVQCQRALRRR